MTNFDYYQDEMLVAVMAGTRCKFIEEHSKAECHDKRMVNGIMCEKCAERFKDWLKEEAEIKVEVKNESALLKNNSEYRTKVKAATSHRTLLEQLAEECNELSIAALKVIRAESLSENPTPINTNAALANFREELADVVMVLDALGFLPLLKITIDGNDYNEKWKRWADRIEAAQEGHYDCE